jgi:Fe-S-cluster containining protein
VTNPCATCTQGCCHEHLVPVTGYDVWLIATSLELAPEQFVVPVAEEEPSATGFLLDRSGQTYDLALGKARARTVEDACLFWIELPGGTGRCGIYPVRPQVCQVYPAALHEGRVVRREDVLCPKPAWRDGTLQRPEWARLLRSLQVEHDVYRLVAARWNRRVLETADVSLAGYYGHVLDCYDRLAPVRAAAAPDEWTASAAAAALFI